MIRIAALASALFAAFLSPTRAEDPIPKADIAKRTKPATVLVDAKPRFGSGFCVHSSGLFVTNNHVVSTVKDGEIVTLVLNAGEPGQKLLKATVARRDTELDLALLRVETEDKIPVLALGLDDKISELDEVISFGFPFGTGLAKAGTYPTISVNASNISSLRRDDKGALNRIQLDGALNPGNSGGPVMARDGKLLGVVVSGIQGAGINMAIPVSQVRRFLDKPEILVSVPAIEPKDKSRPVEFKATVAGILPAEKPYEIELLLNAGDGERRFPMKLNAGKYVATAAPFREAKTAPPRIELRFAEGSLSAPVENGSFTVAGTKYTLSQVRSIRFGDSPKVTLEDGKILEGAVSGLETLTLALPGQKVPVKTAGATELVVAPVAADRGSFVFTVVAKLGDKEIGRQEGVKYLVGMEPGGTEALLKGKFVKPQAALKPTTYTKIVSTSGDYIGQGKSYSYEAKEMTLGANNAGGVTLALGERGGGFTLNVCAPKGEVLKVGEYLSAKRFPFHDKSPGLDFSGQGRGSNALTGKFVIWELEMKGNAVSKCAIDFIQNSEGGTAPLVGAVRFNSLFE